MLRCSMAVAAARRGRMAAPEALILAPAESLLSVKTWLCFQNAALARAWRSTQAKAQSVPPYVIFHDAVLREIAATSVAAANEGEVEAVAMRACSV